MKKTGILMFIVALFSYASVAQQVQFTQADLGRCDSVSNVEVVADLLPSSIVWDSLYMFVNGVLKQKDNQLVEAQLADSIVAAFFYDDPAVEVRDTFVVVETQGIEMRSSITNATRYALGVADVELVDSVLFWVTDWATSSGSVSSFSVGSAVVNASGNIQITATYNSGCEESISVYIPMEEKPELQLFQTVLADPVGQPGIVGGRLSDNSWISKVNGVVVNASSFSIQLSGGLQTVLVTSGSFSWVEQIFVESMQEPEFEIEQTRLARWCDGGDAEVMIVANRGIIDSVANASASYIIDNDTAFVASFSGEQIYKVYSGNTVVDVKKTVEKENDWSNCVYIVEIQQPTCSQSNDGLAIVSYPSVVDSVFVDGVEVPLQDSLTGLSGGMHVATFKGVRGCAFTKNITIPVSSSSCISSPEIFTPNGDGLNDVWQPVMPDGAVLKVQIYSYRDLNMRQLGSKLVFEGRDFWDGTDQTIGSIAEPGFYLISGTISYPDYLNISDQIIKEVVKLVK